MVAAVGDVDLQAARADAKKNPASLDAAAAVLGRLIVDEAPSNDIVNAAKVSAQRAPRNADGNAVALLAGLAIWKTSDPKLAEPYFRRVRRAEPADPDLLAFYRDVYAGEKEAAQLMQVLVQARRANKDDADFRLQLAQEMADIAENKLGSVDRAIEVWRSVLREDGYDEGAATALRRLYRLGEKWTALVELLKDQFERVPDEPEHREDRIQRLLEIAEVYRDQLHLDAMALQTLQRILDIDPRHDASLDALAETYGKAGRWNDLLGVYSRLVDAAQREGDRERQTDMLRRIAAIYLDELNDADQGLARLNEALEVIPGDRQTRAMVARVYELRGEWEALIELLREQLTDAPAEAALEIRVQIARLMQERFDDVEQHIASWNDVLEHHGDVDEALAALASLYQTAQRWPEVAEIVHRRVKSMVDPNAAIKMLVYLGGLYSDQLQSHDEATRVWEEVARLDPNHPVATATLRDTYITSSRWDDLVNLFEGQGRIAEVIEILMRTADDDSGDVDERISLYRRVASLCRDKLGQPARGLAALERMLELKPGDPLTAHEVLPIYREQQDWDKLVAAYEVLLDAADDDDERLEYIAAIRDVALHKQELPEVALTWAGRAYKLRPDDVVLRAGLESAAERCDGWDRLIRLFEARLASDDCDPYERLELLDKLAAVSRDRLNDPQAAERYLKQILDLEPGNEAALASLEDLYTDFELWEQLVAIFRVRLESSDGIDGRLTMLRRIAALQEEQIGDFQAAVATMEEILLLAPTDAGALEGQSRILRKAGDWRQLAHVLEQRIGFMDPTEAQIPLLFELSKVYGERLHESDKAIDGFLKVLEYEPDHLPTIDALEHLRRSDASVALRVVRGLLPYYRSVKDRVKEAEAMEVIANHEPDPGVRRLQLTELLDIYQRMSGREVEALRVRLSLFVTEPLDATGRARLRKEARDLEQLPMAASAFDRAIDHISARINKAENAGREVKESDRALRRNLRIELGSLYRDYLDQPESAERVYKAILAEDESHEEAYESLELLYRARSAHEELVNLYRRRADAIFDADEQRKLLERIVKLARHALDDKTIAIRTAEELLDLEPDDISTIELLAAMYEESDNKDDHFALEELYGRWLDLIDDEELQRQIWCRRAALRKNKLDDVFGAVELLRAVIEQDERHQRARELLEELLDKNEVKLQVATMLEPIYVQLDDHESVIRVLQVRRESAEAMGQGDEAVNFLLQIAQIEEIDLNNRERAFETLRQAYLMDPRRTDTRTEVQRLGLDLEKQRTLVEIWQAAIDRTEDNNLKIDLLSRMSAILDDFLGDVDGARQAYQQLVVLDPPDVSLVEKATRALVRLHREAEDYASLVDALRGQLRFIEDPAGQVATSLEIARLLEEQLEDLVGASTAYYEVLDYDPENTDALDALERLFVTLEDWEQLCDVLRQRVEVVEDDFEKTRLWRKIGEVQRDKAENLHAAIEAYQWIIDINMSDAETRTAIEAMIELNARLERWPDVEEELRRLTSMVDSDVERAALLERTAQVVGDQLLRYPDAVELLYEVLAIDPMHEQARERLKGLFEHESVRARVVEILKPLYEAEQDWTALVDLEERQARTLSRPERVDALIGIAETYEIRLENSERAFNILCGLMMDAGEMPQLPEIIARVERLGQAPERAEALLAAYQETVDNVLDAEVMLQVLRNMGAVSMGRLNKLDEARSAYERVVELEPGDTRALDALELIYVSEDDQEALAELLVRRAEQTFDEARREELWIRAAELFAGELGRTEDAIDLYERLSPETQGRPRVQEKLEALYEKTERHHDLATFLERRIDELDQSELVAVRIRLARLHAGQLANAEEGLRHFAEALRLSPAEALETGELTRYLENGEIRAQVIEVLEPVFVEIADWDRVIQIQHLRLEEAEAPEDQAVVLAKIAEIEELSLGDAEKAFSTYGRVFRLRPGDAGCRRHLDRLARALAKVPEYAKLLTDYLEEEVPGDDRDEILDVVREAAELWVQLAQHRAAVPLYERLLAARPDDPDVFPRLETALRAAEMWAELADAYWQEADGSLDETRQVEVLLRLSQLALNVIVDDAMAVRAFRRVLEVRPGHDEARAQLEGLLERTEQWEALVDALRERQNRTEDLSARADVMLRVASLQDQRLDQPADAIDTLATALMETEGSAVVVQELETIAATREDQRERVFGLLRPIYEDQNNVDRLVGIDEWKLTVADDPETRHQIYREMATLLEPGPDGQAHAFRVLVRALSEPGPHDVTSSLDAELSRLARELHALESLSRAMIEAAESRSLEEERERRVELLVQAARFLLDTGENEPAVEILRGALGVIEDHLEALRLLDDALIRTSRFEELVGVIEQRVRIAESDGDRLELTRRLARLHEDTLANEGQSIAAWRQLLDLEPQDGEALRRLRAAYESNGSTHELIEILERQIDNALDPDERRGLRRDLANIHHRAGNRPAEIDALRELLLEEPGDDAAMESLAKALFEEERYRDAAEVMLDRANAAEADGRRAELLLEVARVYAGPLGDTLTALGHYEGVLMADSGQVGAINDLVTMANQPDDHEAVAALVLPHLDQRGRYKELATVLEARSRLAQDPIEATEALNHLAQVRWERLHDPEGSLEAYNQLMDRVVGEDLEPVLSQAARLSVHLGRADAHVDALARRSTNPNLDPQARVLIAMSAADIAEEIMGDKARALTLLAPLVESGLADGELCKSVERLARSLGDKPLMAVALRQLSNLADGGQERAEILVRLGDAELGAGNKQAAMEAYRDSLDVIPGFAGAVAGLERILELGGSEGATPEVLDSLERAYQDAGNKPGLARLTRTRLETAEGSELLRLLEQLGHLIDEGGGKPRESLEVWGNLMMRDAENESALRRVVELASERSLLSDAIHFMAAAIDAAQEQKRPCFALCIATTRILLEQIGDPTTALRALRPALAENPDSAEALQLQIISARAAGDLEVLHEALTRYAGQLDDPAVAVNFWGEAADVAGRQGQLDRMRGDLEQLIELDESNEAAWHKWLEVLAQTEAWADLAEGLERRAMITEKDDERHILRHHLARILVDRLDRVDDAVTTYNDMLASRPDDLEVMAELEVLLRRHERWHDVRDVLERKAEHVSGEDRVATLEELARIVAVQLETPQDAIEIYHRILGEHPGHPAAQQALEELLTKAERWTELAELKESRIAQLRDEAAGSEAAAR
ncbi:MAG: hypothetical protein KC468_03850, partial [Myxococcales bacterium]|nr:hypothetical protein [Myxococcales bacterium]